MTLHLHPLKFRPELPAAILAISLLCACAAKKTSIAAPTPQAPQASSSAATTALAWTEVSTPFPAADITAVGNVFWVCGADEMIASSSDGGNTWQLKHQSPNGKILTHIAFVDDKIGHAAGKGGLLLSTNDGGRTWKAHDAGDDVLAFSFADAKNGISLIGPEGDVNRSSVNVHGYQRSPMGGAVKLTHDGGEHWDDIPALNSEEFKPFTRVVAVAALDHSHYLMIRNEGLIEDVFVVTQDAGKSWKLVHQRNDATNREFAKYIFVHSGEYWGFGMEMINRQLGGGSGVPLAIHSKDGETWVRTNNKVEQFGGCNAEGCHMWDGAVVSLFGAREQYWTLPQDGSLSDTWAIAGDRVCTIDTMIECGPAVHADQPQPRHYNLPRAAGQPYKVVNLPFAKDCVTCGVKVIRLDPGKNWQGRVVVSFELAPEGAVTNLYEDGAPDGPLGALIEDQVQRWRFRPPAAGASVTAEPRHVPIDVKCVDAPDVLTMDGCRLAPGKQS
jgi:hypothetical protein